MRDREVIGVRRAVAHRTEGRKGRLCSAWASQQLSRVWLQHSRSDRPSDLSSHCQMCVTSGALKGAPELSEMSWMPAGVIRAEVAEF